MNNPCVTGAKHPLAQGEERVADTPHVKGFTR